MSVWITWATAFCLGALMCAFPRALGLPGFILVLTLYMGAQWSVADFRALRPDELVVPFRVIRLDADVVTLEVLPDGPVVQIPSGRVELTVETLTTPSWFFLAGADEFVRLPWVPAAPEHARHRVRSSVPAFYTFSSTQAVLARPVLFAEYRLRIQPGFRIVIDRL